MVDMKAAYSFERSNDMEVLIEGTIVGVVGFLAACWMISRFKGRTPVAPKRQQWASRSPEKLSPTEHRFCLLVARGVKPADAADGIGAVNPKPLAAKWMKKPKIKTEIERLRADEIKRQREAPLIPYDNFKYCRACHRVDCDGSCQEGILYNQELQPTPHDLMPDDTPTADLTEEVGARIKPAEPWEGM
jgi:hypothetical protein